MNRLGFVNFWLYDNETFDLRDGKLMLRGQNGSGKSITTQSFIPFILDGDRSPSHLDPFGSSSRKMEYYFLGDNEKEDSTGYLFLEFYRPDTGECRTIGVGQRARRGKPGLDFWSFILRDGRRIGKDMELFRRAGGVHIPLDKRECRELIGQKPGNLFPESPAEYKKAVNQTFFGFPSIDQYDQFIRLLIKVRAPKLSKEFKPSKVYETLNDSLQPLSEEDLFSMVDAMEKMDEIEDRLNQLKSTRREVCYILDEYRRYNEYITGRKAGAWRNAETEQKEHAQKLSALEAELRSNQAECASAEEEADRLSESIRIAQEKIAAYQSSGLEDQIQKKENCTADLNERENDLTALNARITDLREELVIESRNQKNLKDDIELEQHKLKQKKDALTVLNRQLQYAGHDKLCVLADREEPDQFSLIRRDLDQFQRSLQDLSRKIRQKEAKERECDAVQQDLEEQKHRLHLLELQIQEAEAKTEQERDTLIEAFHILQSDALEYRFEEAELHQFIELVRTYAASSDASSFLPLQNEIYLRAFRKLDGLFQEERRTGESFRKTLARLREELAELEAETEAVPERTTFAEEARAALQKQNIEAIPVYEAIDFREDISMELAARLEAQLLEAGLLDALIVPEAQREQAAAIFRDHADRFVALDQKAASPVSWFMPGKTDVSSDMKQAIAAFLSSLSDRKEDHALILSEDGYYRNGILEGFIPQEVPEVRFIGPAARRAAHQKKIEQKLQEISEQEALLAWSEELCSLIAEHRTILETEKADLPTVRMLDQAILALDSLMSEQTQQNEACAKNEAKLAELNEELLWQKQEIRQQMQKYPYPETSAALEEAEDLLKDYIQDAYELNDILNQMRRLKERLATSLLLCEEKEGTLDKTEDDKRRLQREANRLKEQIAQIEAILNDPENRRMAEEILTVRTSLSAMEQQRKKAENTAVTLSERIRNQKEQLEEKQKELQSRMERAARLKQYFLEELSLALLPMTESCDTEDEKALFTLAKQLEAGIREADRSRSITEISNRLYSTCQSHITGISSTVISIEDCFPSGEGDDLRTRSTIHALVNSRKVSIGEFSALVEENIANTELLIQQKDRELFESILSDTISRKLTARIDESRSWIHDMSSLMKEMDSSMGLSFSLRWHPIASESEDELSGDQLEKILAKDRELLNEEDIRKVADHFRSRIRTARQQAKDDGIPVNYAAMVQDVLDYRKWFEFRMFYTRRNEHTKELTDRAFNTFSGGEKAMAMYIPLFAAVNAQYRKSKKSDHPRIIALDEAFAGVDDINISSMFDLVEKLDFDYIMNSQVLWGCYESVHQLSIAELLRPENAKYITVIFYHWNGKERILDER